MNAINELREKAIQWFNGLDQRERRIVVGGAAVLCLLFVYFLIWEPIVKNMDNMRKSNVDMKQQLVWMQETAAQVKLLKASSVRTGRINKGQSLLGIIDRSSKSSQLALKRVQPDGDSKARVWLENAKFNDVVRWVENLKRRYGVEIDNASFEKQEEPGLVSGRFVFQTTAE